MLFSFHSLTVPEQSKIRILFNFSCMSISGKKLRANLHCFFLFTNFFFIISEIYIFYTFFFFLTSTFLVRFIHLVCSVWCVITTRSNAKINNNIKNNKKNSKIQYNNKQKTQQQQQQQQQIPKFTNGKSCKIKKNRLSKVRLESKVCVEKVLKSLIII